VIRFAAMASMKNTIVLGCFILASAMAHAFFSAFFGAALN
jgi:hypothetical protein